MASPSPTAAQPIAQSRDDGSLAPWPVSDRSPLVIGPGLSLVYISSIFRLSLSGIRQQYVDLLEELLEKDPHSYSVLSKRVLGVSGGRLELTPAECESGSLDETLAQEICDRCTEMLAAIPDLTQHLAALSWAIYYAMAGAETHWLRDGATGFIPGRLSFVHSRRLAYPVPNSWDLYVWDNGLTFAWDTPRQAKMGSFGIRVGDVPGKFIIHAPQIRGAYPTREGIGRQVAYWMMLKLAATKGAPRYLERSVDPWPEAVYSTRKDNQTSPGPGRAASDADIASAKEAVRLMGAGQLSHWVHADTIDLDLKVADGGASPRLTFAEWIAICDGQVSKAVLGGTLSTEVGTSGGNRSLGETQKKSEHALLSNDAKLLAASLKRDLISWMVSLNWPGAPARLIPNVAIHVDDDPDPLKLIEKGAKAAAVGMPVDADALAAEAGVPLIKPGDTKARRLFPIMAQKDPAQFDEDLAARAAAIAKQFPPAVDPAQATDSTATTDDVTDDNDDAAGEDPAATSPEPDDGATDDPHTKD